MTVKELKEFIKDLPDDMNVLYLNADYGYVEFIDLEVCEDVCSYEGNKFIKALLIEG